MFKRTIMFCCAVSFILIGAASNSFAQDTPKYEPPAIQQEGGWNLILVPDL